MPRVPRFQSSLGRSLLRCCVCVPLGPAAPFRAFLQRGRDRSPPPGRAAEDDDGTELPSLEVAKREALATLGEIAHDELPNGDAREFVIEIRDGYGRKPLLSATLSLRVQRLE